MHRILVTGGAGFIGSHVCKALAARGDLPVVVDDLSRGHAGAVRYGPLEILSLTDEDGLRALLRRESFDAVVHLAAYAYVGESAANPGLYFKNNVTGSLCLLEALRGAAIDRLVLSSSCTVYGAPAHLPIGEDHPRSPLNPYGDTKLVVERMLEAYGAAHGLNWMALRYFNAAGADPDGDLGEDHDPETHLIPLVVDAALTGEPLTIFGTDYPTPDGTAIRDYVHVADLADAHLRALDHLLAGGTSGAFNLGTGNGHSVRDIVGAVERVSGARVRTQEAGRRAGDAAVMIADPRRAGRDLGWRTRYSDLDTIIQTAWRWRCRRAKPGHSSRAIRSDRLELTTSDR